MTNTNSARLAAYRALACTMLLGTCLAGTGDPGIAQPNPTAGADPSANNAGAELPADPECLTIAQSSTATYTITNSACPDQSVLAAIELAGEGDLNRCFTKKIRTQISLASEHAAPVINYQCIEGAKGCSVEILRGMFPECHAG